MTCVTCQGTGYLVRCLGPTLAPGLYVFTRRPCAPCQGTGQVEEE